MKPVDLRAFLVSLVVFAFAAASPGLRADTPATRPAPRGPWTTSAVLAALDWRESRLADCSIRTEETMVARSRRTGAERLWNKLTLDIRRRNGCMFVDATYDDLNSPGLNYSHALATWDGSVCQWLGHPIQKVSYRWDAGIIDQAPEIMRFGKSFEVLGLFKYTHGSWAQWIRELASSRGTEITVSDRVEDGEHVVQLDATPIGAGPPQGNRIRFVYSADNDFVLKRYQISPPCKGGQFVLASQYDLTKVEKIDGLSMPVDAQIQTGLEYPDEESTYKYYFHLAQYSSAPPQEQQVQIVFPPDTLVIDRIKMKCYLIRPDGSHEPRSFYDSSSGKVIEPAASQP